HKHANANLQVPSCQSVSISGRRGHVSGEVAMSNRGFGLMSRSRRREVASKGGCVAHQRGTAHRWTREEAREAGRKGGGVLLASGVDDRNEVAGSIADALDEVALTLDQQGSRVVGDTKAFLTIQRSITRALEAFNRVQERMPGPSPDVSRGNR